MLQPDVQAVDESQTIHPGYLEILLEEQQLLPEQLDPDEDPPDEDPPSHAVGEGQFQLWQGGVHGRPAPQKV